MLALTAVIVKVAVSALVFRHLEYTLEAVAMLSLLPPFQTIVLSIVARPTSPGRRLPRAVELASRRSLQLVGAMLLVAVGAWLALSTDRLLPDTDPRSLLTLLSGAILGSAALRLLVIAGRWPRKLCFRRLLPCALACGCVAVSCIVEGLGYTVNPWPSLAVVTAATWVLTAAILLLCLVGAADVMPPGPALLLEIAAVLAAATMSVVPLTLYLRPYLGNSWLDPGRFAMLAGATLILTASIAASSPRDVDRSIARVAAPTTRNRAFALWLTLQASYLVGWAGIGLLVAGSPDLSPAACTHMVVIPLTQAFAILMLQALRVRGTQFA